jgi:hypothetical protein
MKKESREKEIGGSRVDQVCGKVRRGESAGHEALGRDCES